MLQAETSTTPTFGTQDLPKVVRRAIAVAGVAKMVHSGYRSAHSWYTNNHGYQITLEGTEDIYGLFSQWLIGALPAERQRSVAVRSIGSVVNSTAPVSSDDYSEPAAATLGVFYSGTKRQAVRIEGHRVEVTLERDAENDRFKGNERARDYFQATETIHIHALTAEARLAVLRLLDRLMAENRKAEPRLNLYTSRRYGGWSRVGSAAPRGLDGVVLADGQVERIAADIEQFLANAEDYRRLGMPHHRGYLFWGPPGTGKTSLVRALASHFGLSLYVLSLSDVEDDSTLIDMVGSLPQRSILLLEDVDVSRAVKERTDDDHGATMSGLLNALDGVATPDGVIVMMTTNHPDVFDDAVVRSGRIDVSEELDLADADQVYRLIRTLSGEDMDVFLDGPVRPSDVVEIAKANIADRPAMVAAYRERYGIKLESAWT